MCLMCRHITAKPTATAQNQTSKAKSHTSDPPGSTQHSTMSIPPNSHYQNPQKANIDPLLHHVKTHNQQQQNPTKKTQENKKMKIKKRFLRVSLVIW
jgi:hypothetical protein